VDVPDPLLVPNDPLPSMGFSMIVGHSDSLRHLVP
jgi:hypothetical protein